MNERMITIANPHTVPIYYVPGVVLGILSTVTQSSQQHNERGTVIIPNLPTQLVTGGGRIQTLAA